MWCYRWAKTGGQHGCTATYSLPRLDYFPCFFVTRFALCCVFDFALNFVRLTVNGAWLVLGINDMTRDTPLLEFSQVRATPIEDTWVPLCLPSCGRKAPCSFSLILFLLLFLLFFQLIKERWTQKSLLEGIWRWARGRVGLLVRCWRRAAVPERRVCVYLYMNEAAEFEQPALAARCLALSISLVPLWDLVVLAFARAPFLLAFCLSLTDGLLSNQPIGGFGKGCRRWGAAPQWISGWHGDVSLVVGALPQAPACLF